MKIIYRKNFVKKYKKLSPKLKDKITTTLKQFKKNPHNPILKNHALKGRLKGLRALSVTGDLRVIFKAYDDYVIVIMLDVGIHNQVY
jgi:addiction module RelE/StbE family toxin